MGRANGEAPPPPPPCHHSKDLEKHAHNFHHCRCRHVALIFHVTLRQTKRNEANLPQSVVQRQRGEWQRRQQVRSPSHKSATSFSVLSSTSRNATARPIRPATCHAPGATDTASAPASTPQPTEIVLPHAINVLFCLSPQEALKEKFQF